MIWEIIPHLLIHDVVKQENKLLMLYLRQEVFIGLHDIGYQRYQKWNKEEFVLLELLLAKQFKNW